MLNQERYIQYIAKFAADHEVHIRLGGSFQKGTASPYSDVDISVAGDAEQVKQLIYGYGQPVFLSHTTNPMGILIVIYEDGVQVDLEVVSDVATTVTGYFHSDDAGAAEAARNESIFRELVLRDDEPYQISRLFHRSMIKYLSGKEDTGVSVANEIVAFLKSGETVSKETYREGMRSLLDRFSAEYPMEEKYEKLLRQMLTCDWCSIPENECRYQLAESGHWRVFLADEQDYVGRCVLVLRRHCESLSELTEEEWMELHRMVRLIESCVKEVFGAELCNWSCLMNSFYKSSDPNPHVHVHVRPRYRTPVTINGHVYADAEFGHHYSLQRNSRVSEEDMQAIFRKMKQWFVDDNPQK